MDGWPWPALVQHADGRSVGRCAARLAGAPSACTRGNLPSSVPVRNLGNFRYILIPNININFMI
jgi:hypothetical protein